MFKFFSNYDREADQLIDEIRNTTNEDGYITDAVLDKKLSVLFSKFSPFTGNIRVKELKKDFMFLTIGSDSAEQEPMHMVSSLNEFLTILKDNLNELNQ